LERHGERHGGEGGGGSGAAAAAAKLAEPDSLIAPHSFIAPASLMATAPKSLPLTKPAAGSGLESLGAVHMELRSSTWELAGLMSSIGAQVPLMTSDDL
jgi:hypothetical protein